MISASFPLRQHPKWVRGIAHIEDDAIVLDKASAEEYSILQSEYRPSLLMDLTGLRDCKPEDVLRFVRRHGLLWHGPRDLESGECREYLRDWRLHVGNLWLTTRLYLSLRVAQEAGTAKPLRAFLRGLRAMDLFYALIPDNDQECLETVSVLIAERTSSGMEGCNWTLIAECTLAREGVQEGDAGDFAFGDDPQNLVAAAYAQLAEVMANKIPFRECEGCGKLFPPKHGSQTYCDSRCNARVRKARQRAKEI